jgi:hypothetical protein
MAKVVCQPGIAIEISGRHFFVINQRLMTPLGPTWMLMTKDIIKLGWSNLNASGIMNITCAYVA